MRQLFIAAALACSFQLSAQDEPGADLDAYFPQQITAKELKLACAASALTSTGRERRRYCSGFVSGVEEGLRVLQQQVGVAGLPGLCVPPQTSSRAFRDAYTSYAGRKGVDLGRPAALVVLEALGVAFPCPGTTPAPTASGQ